jgi:hypothetical protein
MALLRFDIKLSSKILIAKGWHEIFSRFHFHSASTTFHSVLIGCTVRSHYIYKISTTGYSNY